MIDTFFKSYKKESNGSIILQEDVMSKNYLLIISIILVAMGLLFFWPIITIGDQPWHAVVKILLGIVGIWIAFTEKK